MAGRVRRERANCSRPSKNNLLVQVFGMTNRRSLQKSQSRLLLIWLLPVVIALCSTFAVVLAGPNRFPRSIAAGSSLAVPGLVASVIVSLILFGVLWRLRSRPQERQASMVLGILASLISWPIWSSGVMPSINGFAVRQSSTTTMQLQRLEITHATKSREVYHWARLAPLAAESGLKQGRYFVPADRYDIWERHGAKTVEVRHGTGLLGAEIVLSFL